MQVEREGKQIGQIDREATTKKEALLSDPNVRRWYENLQASSKHTAEVAVRRLGRFCELAQV